MRLPTKILAGLLTALLGLLLTSCSSSIPTSSGSTLSASPGSLSFPSTPVGSTSAPQSVVLTNTGARSVTISTMPVVSGPFSFSGLNVPRSIGPNQSVTFQVTFTPTMLGATSGSNNLVINSDASNSPTTVGLSGTGSQPSGPALFPSSTSLAFSQVVVGQSSSMTVTLTNFGTASTTITAITLPPSAGFSFSGITLPATVPPNGATPAMLTVTYAPTTPGPTPAGAAALITSNAPNSPLSIALSGTGIQPAISASPSSLAFGMQTVSSTSISLPVTTTNTGSAPLHISNCTTSITQFAVSPNCSTAVVIAVGASSTFMVTFTPDSAVSFSGTLTFTSDAPTSPTTVSLSGTGTTATAVANLLPSSVNFEGETVGKTTSPVSVLVTNGGTSSFQVTGATAAAPFAVTGFTAQQLKPQQSLTLNLTFAPTVTGDASGTLTVTFDSLPNSPAALSGIGINICDGISFTQSPAPEDVTSQFTEVTSGLQIIQATSTGTNSIPDVGIPPFSALTNVFLFNGLVNKTISVLNEVPDGTGSQLIVGNVNSQALFGFDGRLAVFAGPGDKTGEVDVFANFLLRTDSHNVQNACTAQRLTNLNMKPATGNTMLKFSEPVPCHDQLCSTTSDGKDVMVFAPASAMRRVLEDGTLLDGDLNSPGFDPPDKYQGQNFNRLRLNPKFPEWVLYSRNQAASENSTPELWLFDFTNQGLCSVGPLGIPLIHEAWSPDGTTIVAEQNVTVGHTLVSHAQLFTIFNADGTFATGVSCPPGSPGTFNVSGAVPNDVSAGVNQPADSCDFPPEGSPAGTPLVCTSGDGSVLDPATGNLVPQAVYLLSQSISSPAYKFLSSTDAKVLTPDATPIAVFSQDASHIIFRSDRTSGVQIYLLSGFTPTVP